MWQTVDGVYKNKEVYFEPFNEPPGLPTAKSLNNVMRHSYKLYHQSDDHLILDGTVRQ